MAILSLQEHKALTKRSFLEHDPRIASFLDLCEHYNPVLHNIHDKESCSFCKQRDLVHNANEPTIESAKKQITALFYNPETASLSEKETECSYSVKIDSARHKLLATLIRKRHFVPTNILASASSIVDAGSVSRTIQKINKMFASHFETEQKLILGKNGSGYRINPEIRIVSEK